MCSNVLHTLHSYILTDKIENQFMHFNNPYFLSSHSGSSILHQHWNINGRLQVHSLVCLQRGTQKQLFVLSCAQYSSKMLIRHITANNFQNTGGAVVEKKKKNLQNTHTHSHTQKNVYSPKNRI